MKKLILLSSLLLLTFNLQAQSNGGTVVMTNIPPSQANFFTTLSMWGTSRTASGLVWTNNDFDINIGADYQNNMQWANEVDVQKNFNQFYVGAQIDNLGIAGTIEEVGGRVGYTLSNVGDLRIKAGAYAGYAIHNVGNLAKGMVMQPELGGEKKMTLNTFASAWVYYPVQLHGSPSQYPGFRIAVGTLF